MTHPDNGGCTNVFSFMTSCRDPLANPTLDVETSQSQQTVSPSNHKKKPSTISLPTLYDIFFSLYRYEGEYNITKITASAKVTMYPLFRKKLHQQFSVDVSVPFADFKKSAFVNLSGDIFFPENFNKFRIFRIRVEFLGDTHKFVVSNNSFRVIKYYYNKILKSMYFKTILTLNFKKQNVT